MIPNVLTHIALSILELNTIVINIALDTRKYNPPDMSSILQGKNAIVNGVRKGIPQEIANLLNRTLLKPW